MNTEVPHAESDVLKLKARANLLFALLSHAQQELEQSKRTMQELITHRDQRFRELENEAQLRADRLLELDNEVRRRDGRIIELDNELQRRGNRLDVVEKELARLNTELQELKVAEANYKMTLAGITQSTSWRITAPWRALGQAVKRAR